MNKKFRIGTSGYSYDDWRGHFYPESLSKNEMLVYYCNYFNCVELNATYYTIPTAKTFQRLNEKTPDQFEFIIKTNQETTHRRKENEQAIQRLREAIKPLEEHGKMHGFLAQFPYSFKFSPDGLDYLATCRDALLPHHLFVEFRHDSWVNRIMYDRLRAEQIGYVSVDEPQLSGLLKPHLVTTTDVGYVRLHGRNADKWWDGGKLRYDYNYSAEELEVWQKKIENVKYKVKKMYIFFNNCHQGKAVSNAKQFMHLLGI